MLKVPGIACKASALVIASMSCLCANAEPQKKERHCAVDGFVNVKCAHERKNNYFFGPKNTSAIAITPFLQVKNFSIDADFWYGRQYKFSGYTAGTKDQARFVGDLDAFLETCNVDENFLRNTAGVGCKNGLGKAHFYRNYLRVLYINQKNNFKVVMGDTATRNTIGFQKVVSGAGISIFRQGGNGSVVNPGLPIVVTRLSKAEIRLNGEILALKILRPGTYTIDQLGPEALLPGVIVKLSDQMSRSETFKVDYFSGYGMPELGKDDFDFTAVFPSRYDLDDPHKLHYSDGIRVSGNYRKTFKEEVTYALGVQAYEDSVSFDAGLIFNTKYGKIAPNIGFCNNRGYVEGDGVNQKSYTKNAIAASLYYALPENKYGIFAEAQFSIMSKGYGSLGSDNDQVDAYNDYLDRYFFNYINTNFGGYNTPDFNNYKGRAGINTSGDLFNKLKGSHGGSSSKQLVARVYTKPIWNITPAFTFKGVWSSSQRSRDYTIAFMTRVFDKCNLTLSGGLTYDDPKGGFNRKSPDRRLTLACAVDLNSEWSAEYTYGQYYDDMRRNYGSITYTPEAIKGLELCAEYTRKPGLAAPVFSVKYDGKYFDAKFEQSTPHVYENKDTGTLRNAHSNDQLFLFGTSLSRKGFGSMRKTNVNIVRSLGDYKN